MSAAAPKPAKLPSLSERLRIHAKKAVAEAQTCSECGHRRGLDTIAAAIGICSGTLRSFLDGSCAPRADILDAIDAWLQARKGRA